MKVMTPCDLKHHCNCVIMTAMTRIYQQLNKSKLAVSALFKLIRCAQARLTKNVSVVLCYFLLQNINSLLKLGTPLFIHSFTTIGSQPFEGDMVCNPVWSAPWQLISILICSSLNTKP